MSCCHPDSPRAPRTVLTLLWLFLGVLITDAQDNEWPRAIQASSGTIILYQPQPESFIGNKITSRCAVSYTEDMGEPVFGAIWTEATVSTDRDSRMAVLESIKVTNVKFPANEDTSRRKQFRALLEKEIPRWNLEISLDQLAASLEMAEQEKSLAEELKNDPPTIIYKNTPSFLVVVDGEPRIQQDKKLGIDRVVNTPYVIVKDKDGKFYLFLASSWFSATAVTGDFTLVESPPKNIIALEKKIQENASDAGAPKTKNDTIPAIIVATTPTELIQSNGEGKFNPVQGTNLLYMSNTDNDIFMEITTQQFFVLISGRWYASAGLQGPWIYTSSDKLPEDFRKIPKGSDKDNVLASVAGTPEAKDALADAQVPQTAKVDRKKATTKVTYDGDPKFEKIEGTALEYAVNTSATVLKSGTKYYAVENGVWFESTKPTGSWKACTERPADVEKIPPSNPKYNVKYVYIYDSTPEYIYMGYTSGYLGCYPYGPTVVYGTGWYYPPYFGPYYYYPHPMTWGFSMHYNPWTGFSMGVGFTVGFGFGMSFYGGGYWGPPMYHPPFRPPYHRYYGGRPVHIHTGDININNGNINNINRDRTNNLYSRRNDVATRDVNRGNLGAGTRDVPGGNSKPAMTREGTRMPNNVQADRNGGVYRQNQDRQWNERQGSGWGQANQSRDFNELNRTQQSRDMGQMRHGGFNQTNRGAGMGGGMRGGMGGGRGR
jgi:hypothetical protein